MSEKYKDNSGNAYDPNLIDFRSEIASLNADLEAAKLREAELANALEIARTAIEAEITEKAHTEPHYADYWRGVLSTLQDPSAALAERDRGIERKTAERCAEIAHSMYPAGWCREKILREFSLEPKPEGVVAFFGTWPGDETDKDLHDAAKDIL